jgi:hypothetical protein
MQERRFRPGDVLDDYCPHERRITDHAIVAMIDDEIRRTRCVVCDAEHEYKAAKVPTRRKTAPVALFTQVLDGLQGPTARPASSSPPPPLDPPIEPEVAAANDEPAAPTETRVAQAGDPETAADGPAMAASDEREDGPVRRSLIRAQFPRVEGQPTATRTMPEFTVHTLHNRGGRNGNHSHRGSNNSSFRGPMRFGRDNGHGSPDGSGRPHGQRHRRRRGGKKHQ